MAKSNATHKKYVKMEIPRIPGAPAEQQIFVFGINGKNYKYPRGVKISVLEHIEQHISECLKAESEAEMKAEAASRKMLRQMTETLLGTTA